VRSYTFFLPEVTGGVKTYINNLAEFLEKAGIHYKIVSYSFEASLFQKKKIKNNQVRLRFSKYSKISSCYSFIRKEISAEDVLICNDSFELGAISYLRLSNKIIYILHGDLAHYHAVLKYYHPVIDKVICVSHGLQNKYSPLFPGLPFDVSHPFVSHPATENKQGNAVPRGIFIGRFELLKGADLFLQLANTYGNPVKWTVITTAAGADEDLLKRLPADVEILKDLPNEEVLGMLATCDVLIFPSRTEGFGIVVLEALSKGVIPFVLDIPIGIPDQVVHGFNGFVIKESAWQHEVGPQLSKLLTDETELARLRKNAALFVKTYFDPKKITEHFIQQMEQAMPRREKYYPARETGFMEKMVPEYPYRLLKYTRSFFINDK
jgi:glycosyltransferase involved in cell wall biosynthesis